MRNIFICLTIVFMIIGCKQEEKVKAKSKLNIVGDEELLKGWKVFANDSIKINIPFSWKSKKEDGTLFYVPLNKDKANLYFVILKTNTSIVNIKNYIKEVFRQVSLKDKKFTYLITKIGLENNTFVYTIDFYSKEKTIAYKAYCLLYQKNNMIYDFSYKCLNKKELNIENYRLFYNVLLSFRYNKNIIIDSKNFIVKSEEIIKYENL